MSDVGNGAVTATSGAEDARTWGSFVGTTGGG